MQDINVFLSAVYPNLCGFGKETVGMCPGDNNILIGRITCAALIHVYQYIENRHALYSLVLMSWCKFGCKLY